MSYPMSRLSIAADHLADEVGREVMNGFVNGRRHCWRDGVERDVTVDADIADVGTGRSDP